MGMGTSEVGDLVASLVLWRRDKKMALETKSTESEMENIRRLVAELRARAARYRKEHPGEPFPFMKYAGFLKGKNPFHGQGNRSSQDQTQRSP